MQLARLAHGSGNCWRTVRTTTVLPRFDEVLSVKAEQRGWFQAPRTLPRRANGRCREPRGGNGLPHSAHLPEVAVPGRSRLNTFKSSRLLQPRASTKLVVRDAGRITTVNTGRALPPTALHCPSSVML